MCIDSINISLLWWFGYLRHTVQAIASTLPLTSDSRTSAAVTVRQVRELAPQYPEHSRSGCRDPKREGKTIFQLDREALEARVKRPSRRARSLEAPHSASLCRVGNSVELPGQ